MAIISIFWFSGVALKFVIGIRVRWRRCAVCSACHAGQLIESVLSKYTNELVGGRDCIGVLVKPAECGFRC